MLKKLLVELDERGATAENLALGTRYASAKWYHDLQKAAESDKEALLSEALSRHIQELLAVIEPEVFDFATKLSKLDAGKNVFEVCEQHYKVNLSDNIEMFKAVDEHNRIISTLPTIRGQRLQMGHILNLCGEYWICLSAACDLVPGQLKSKQKEMVGENGLPFIAVRLQETTSAKAAKKANDKRFIYLKIGNVTKYFCINSPDSASSYLDWHTFVADDLGAFNKDSRVLQVIQKKIVNGMITLTTDNAEVVGQLRYTYAVNLAQELGRWISRIGLDFLSVR
tara:strand:- start:200 stop:1045 length:846 start_codon:yes stop_codon:yes gene_type:complete